MIPTYSPHQLVRIELLRYQNPDGLHPIEEAHRDLAKDMLSHIEHLQNLLEEIKPKLPSYNHTLDEWIPIKFPGKFTPTI